MGWKLADLFVQFIVKGAGELVEACDKALVHLSGIKTGMDVIGRQATIGMAAATASLGGFIRAGMAGTAMSQQLGFQMERLSRSIAGLFAPELNKAIALVRQLSEWMRNLSDVQRANIVRWIEAAGAAAAVAIILPRIVAGIQATITAVRTLTAAIIAGEAIISGGILPLVGAFVSALAALVVGTEVGRRGLGSFWDVIQRVGATLAQVLEPAIEGIATIVGRLTSVFDQMAGPIAEAVGEVLATLKPLLDMMPEIYQAVGDFMVAGLKAAAMALIGFLTIIRPFASFVVQVATVLWNVMIPAFKAWAFILEKIARLLAFITGKKMPTEEPGKVQGPDTKKNRGPLAPAAGGFENVDAVYNRIAQASVMLGRTVEEQQLDEQKLGNRILDRIDAKLGNQQPAFAR